MKPFLFLALLCILKTASATDYYFSSSFGDDNRSFAQAQNPSTPWRSVAKLNTIFSSLNPGDHVYFNRGETFYGALTVNKSGTASQPITLAAYGYGASPVITGFTGLGNWVSVGNGIWESYAPSLGSEVKVVTINNTSYAMGRYPNSTDANKGYLTYEAHLTNKTITDYELTSSTNWTGAEVVIRTTRAAMDRGLITSHFGNTISYNSSIPWGANDGFGYFIQKDIRTLDQYGEWFYNPSTKKMYVFFGSGGPAGDVQASNVSTLITSKYQSNIVFDGLTFTGSNINTFDIYFAKNIQIKNSQILFSGTDAITAADAQNLVIENNTINYTNSDGITFQYACDNSIVRNNRLYNTGVNAGMGKPNYALCGMVLINSPNTIVEYNEIVNTGYIPISFGGNNITIKNNFINTFLFVKDDGGGIYTSNMNPGAVDNYGRRIIGNIILNAVGAQAGTNDFINTGAQGIYMDYNAGGVEVSGNTIANCSETGFYNDVCHDVVVKDNTFYNNGTQTKMIQFGSVLVRNLVFQNNILFSKIASQPSAIFSSAAFDIGSFGFFDNNYYARPIAEDFLIKTKQGLTNTYTYKYLNDWKSTFNLDWNSKSSPVQIAPYTLHGFLSGNKVSAYQAVSQNQSVHVSVGSMENYKQYILKFVSNSSAEGVASFRFLQDHNPYYNLVDARKIKLPAGRTEHEYLVSFPPSDYNMALRFETEMQSAYAIENLQLYEANVTITNPDDHIRFEYNASASSKTISLDAAYVDVRNTPYSGNITLSPYTSVVLIRTGAVTTPVAPAPEAPAPVAPTPVLPAPVAPDVVVQDPVAPPPATGSATTGASTCANTGGISIEQWNNITGENIWDIPVQNAAATSGIAPSLEAVNLGENTGTRMRGYICPPETGNYTFYISGDDAVDLFISTDDNPANKTKIAGYAGWTSFRQFDKFNAQQAIKQVYLETGKRYYIEVLNKNGGATGHVSVKWQLPSGSTEAPIPGNRLIPFDGAAPVTPTATACSNTGSILFERWNNVAGNHVWDIPVQNTPSVTSRPTSLEGFDLGENYGVRMRGYICPPETGNYTFWIAGDDAVDLFISTDDNPSNKVKIAGYAGWTAFRQFDKFKAQQGVQQVYLETGRKYYIEVLHKNGGSGGGSGHVSVKWQLPSGGAEAPIPGNRLIPFEEVYNMSAARMSANNTVDMMAAVNPARGESALDVYPNPFKSVATARFFSKEAGVAALDVFDVNGRKIQRLFAGKVDANTSKTFNLQSKGLASGTYIIRYTLNGKFLNKKVILAK